MTSAKTLAEELAALNITSLKDPVLSMGDSGLRA